MQPRVEGSTVWTERTVGEGVRTQVVPIPEEEFGAPAMMLMQTSFAGSDWFDIPAANGGPFGAPSRRRVTHRFKAPCWCGCGSEEAWHLHGGNAGVIECVATGQFKFYDAEAFRAQHPTVALAVVR